MADQGKKCGVIWGIGPWQTCAGIALSIAFGLMISAILGMLDPPASTVIEFKYEPTIRAACPDDLLLATDVPPLLRLGFVGDIMQHANQAGDNFASSYSEIEPLISGFDLATGNMEFPVDPTKPVGPFFGFQFNGDPAHVDALAGAGFDVISTANNHSFDQSLDGALHTIDVLEERNLISVGTWKSGTQGGPVIVEANGTRIAFLAYTVPPNSYARSMEEKDNEEVRWWHADWPLFELNFWDWNAEYRKKGLEVFERHIAEASAARADFTVALVHWGDEWHFYPDENQKNAARDIIDAGFDLVVGSHAHVINPPEIYKGKLIAYSLGNFISDFVDMETRLGAVLQVELGRAADGSTSVWNFGYYLVLTERDGHIIRPLTAQRSEEEERAWRLGSRIIGASVVPYDPRQQTLPPRLVD